MNGIRREQTELDRTGLDWTSTDSTQWTGPDQTRMEYTSAEWTGLKWTEPKHFRRLKWTALYLIGLEGLSLSLTSPDCSTLHYPQLNWKVPYRTVSSLHLARLICTEVHCTFPNETDKDCTALHVNVLHWTRPHRISLHSAGSKFKGLCWIA